MGTWVRIASQLLSKEIKKMWLCNLSSAASSPPDVWNLNLFHPTGLCPTQFCFSFVEVSDSLADFVLEGSSSISFEIGEVIVPRQLQLPQSLSSTHLKTGGCKIFPSFSYHLCIACRMSQGIYLDVLLMSGPSDTLCFLCWHYVGFEAISSLSSLVYILGFMRMSHNLVWMTCFVWALIMPL